MKSKEIIRCLRLMADTIEDLEITNIISCNVDNSTDKLIMSVHLDDLIVSGVEPTWTERQDSAYNWEKSIIYNDIKFYAIYTDEDYQKEKKL